MRSLFLLIREPYLLQTEETPIALSIAGFDCSAGAGVLADLKVFARLGVHGIAATTAVVAQRPGSVSAIQLVDLDVFSKQLDELSVYPISAIKIGMLGNSAIQEIVERFLAEHPKVPVVLDPVLRATAGADLYETEQLGQLTNNLFPLTTLITPNRSEAEAILSSSIQSPKDIEKSCRQLAESFGCSVLLKGGHFEAVENQVIDYFYNPHSAESVAPIPSPRLDIPDLHGTGCHLSSAIAAYLACGEDLQASVSMAHADLQSWMADYRSWQSDEEQIHAIN